MIRFPVQSTNIKAIGHDLATNTLEVEFHSGKVWRYQDVNADEHARLLRANSIGSHFSKFIRPYKSGSLVQQEHSQ